MIGSGQEQTRLSQGQATSREIWLVLLHRGRARTGRRGRGGGYPVCLVGGLPRGRAQPHATVPPSLQPRVLLLLTRISSLSSLSEEGTLPPGVGRLTAGAREHGKGYRRGKGAWGGLSQRRGSTARVNKRARGDGTVNTGAREHGEGYCRAREHSKG